MATSFKPSNSAKVKAPWDPESIVFGEESAADPHVRGNAPWEFYSQTSAEERAVMERKVLADSYKMAPPWGHTDSQLLDEFDAQLEVQDNILVEPWNDPRKGGIIPPSANQMQKIENYKFEALWEPLPVDPKRMEMTRNYKAGVTCPFLRDDNRIPEDEKAKKHRERLAATIPHTVAPWAQGSLPAAANTKQVVTKKETSLWNVPLSVKKEYPFEPSGDPILDNVRLELWNRGASGIFGLSRKFKIMDDDGSGTLDLHEFRKAMKELNMKDLKDAALNHLFRFFDRDDSGNISYDEFLVGIRGQLNKRRDAMVAIAFKCLDKDMSGVIELNDIKETYNCKFHPDFINNRRTEEDILKEFLSSFEGRGKKVNRDFKITMEEFKEYYSNLSACIDSDDYFELMIRNSWHISGGEGWAANTTNKRVMVTLADGKQQVVEVKNDLKLLSGKSKQEQQAAIAKQLQAEGHDLVDIDTMGGLGQGKGMRGLSDKQLANNPMPPLPAIPSTVQTHNTLMKGVVGGSVSLGNFNKSPSNSNISPRSQVGLNIIMNNSNNSISENNGVRRPSSGSLGKR